MHEQWLFESVAGLHYGYPSACNMSICIFMDGFPGQGRETGFSVCGRRCLVDYNDRRHSPAL